MTAPRRIGVLGGMGPEATVLLMQRLIAAVPARDDADHVPLLVDNNTQVPSRIAALIDETGEDPAPVLASMAKRLEAMGAEALIMPCNTAHYYAPAIEAAVSIELLNMIDLSVAEVVRQTTQGSRVGLLASPAVRTLALFDRALGEAGRAVCYPENNDAILAAIKSLKAHGVNSVARGLFERAAQQLAGDGVEIIVIACSEFSILGDAVSPPVATMDTLDVLVKRTVEFAFDAIHPDNGNQPARVRQAGT